MRLRVTGAQGSCVSLHDKHRILSSSTCPKPDRRGDGGRAKAVEDKKVAGRGPNSKDDGANHETACISFEKDIVKTRRT